MAFFLLLDLLRLDLPCELDLLGEKGEIGDEVEEKVSDENEDEASVRAVCPDSGENDLGVLVPPLLLLV